MILSILATVAVLAAIAVITAALVLAETVLVYVALGLAGVSALLLLGALLQGRPGGERPDRSGTDGLGKSSVHAETASAAAPGVHVEPEHSGRVPAPAGGPVREVPAPDRASWPDPAPDDSGHGEPEYDVPRWQTPTAHDWPEPDTVTPDPVEEEPSHWKTPAEGGWPVPAPRPEEHGADTAAESASGPEAGTEPESGSADGTGPGPDEHTRGGSPPGDTSDRPAWEADTADGEPGAGDGRPEEAEEALLGEDSGTDGEPEPPTGSDEAFSYSIPASRAAAGEDATDGPPTEAAGEEAPGGESEEAEEVFDGASPDEERPADEPAGEDAATDHGTGGTEEREPADSEAAEPAVEQEAGEESGTGGTGDGEEGAEPAAEEDTAAPFSYRLPAVLSDGTPEEEEGSGAASVPGDGERAGSVREGEAGEADAPDAVHAADAQPEPGTGSADDR